MRVRNGDFRWIAEFVNGVVKIEPLNLMQQRKDVEGSLVGILFLGQALQLFIRCLQWPNISAPELTLELILPSLILADQHWMFILRHRESGPSLRDVDPTPLPEVVPPHPVGVPPRHEFLLAEFNGSLSDIG